MSENGQNLQSMKKKKKRHCSANCDPQAKPSVLVNRVLLEHIRLLFAYWPWNYNDSKGEWLQWRMHGLQSLK